MYARTEMTVWHTRVHEHRETEIIPDQTHLFEHIQIKEIHILYSSWNKGRKERTKNKFPWENSTKLFCPKQTWVEFFYLKTYTINWQKCSFLFQLTPILNLFLYLLIYPIPKRWSCSYCFLYSLLSAISICYVQWSP